MRMIVLIFFLLLLPLAGQAQDDSLEILDDSVSLPPANQLIDEEFYRGEVTEIISEQQEEEVGLNGARPFTQEVRVRLTTGPRAGEEVTIQYGVLQEDQKLLLGDAVVIVNPAAVTGTSGQVYVFEKYRLNLVLILLALFVILAVVFAGWRGITSMVGLGVSVAILALYVVPQIVGGANPLLVSMVASFAIAIISIYLAHGISKRTSVAVVSTLITIGLAIVLALGAVSFLGLSGSGSEEAYFLQTSPIENLNLKGLLLGAIIIGALGVLDDITTAQAAAVDEIRKADPKLTAADLFKRGMSVGREHITSLINTLALAYAGTALPALLLFTVYQRPLWVVANTEAITEEIVRTLVGSTALMVAVPITTFLAANILSKYPPDPKSDNTGKTVGHSH
ncbi:MAG: YibE/F family protein [Candidatus Andersenbacteria bacterium]